MEQVLFYLKNMDKFVQFIIEHGGLFLLMFIIFAETGLFAGFFLPGDSLLFVAGIFIRDFAVALFKTDKAIYSGFFHWHFIVILLMVIIAAIIGNLVGYWFGRKSGPLLYERKDTLFFKKKHLEKAEKFYEKNGTLAIIMGRFVPFVRTFAPIVAGMVKMDYKKFLNNTIVGAVAWICIMMLAGYFLQDLFMSKFNMDLSKRIEIIAIGIIFVTTAPVIYKGIKESRSAE